MFSKILNLTGSILEVTKLFAFILIGAVVELLSVGAIIPTIFLISNNPDNNLIMKIDNFLSGFSFYNSDKLPIIILTFLTSIFLFKFIYILFLTYYQTTFSKNLSIRLSDKFLKSYLLSDFQFHIKHNSAILIRNINTEINVFIKNVFYPALVCILEIIIIGSTIIFLLFFNFKVTIIVLFIMSILIFFYFLAFRKSFINWGFQRQYHDGMKLKNLIQSLEFVKLIKFYKKENFFTEKFNYHIKKSGLLSRKISVTFQFPRLFLEFFTILCIAITSIYLIGNNIELSNLFETLAVYIAVAYRLIPGITKLSSNYQAITTGKAAIEKLYEEHTRASLDKNLFINDAVSQNKNITLNDNIEIKNLFFNYDDSKNNIFENLDFKINKGEFVGIVGESGSGKSTFVDLILGILKPKQGKIYVDGKELSLTDNINIGYVTQNVFIMDDSIANNIAFGIKENEINYKLIFKVLELSKLYKLINNLPEGINSEVGEKGARLSGGEAQRINIARALYLEPEILILDESTSALDLKTENELLKDLKELQKTKTIIIISHRKESIVFCDKVYELKGKSVKKIEK